ncbi:hypothetical protein TWF730_010179 [Orbilia blumenaviensis]|uniref:Uncharacterized protein n=1 Tax=Orbilia blumenaviensis TaxID=1796055 RepID=A0AAV9UMH4_9PEZI
MANRTKEYFLAPRFDIPPPAVQLGSIIRDKESPRETRGVETVRVPDSCIELSQAVDYEDSFETKARFGASLFAEVLKYVLGVGINIGTRIQQAESMELRCERLETRCFDPTPEYLQQAMQKARENPTMNRYLSKRGIIGNKRKLFMVTGVKVAEGLTISTKTKSDLALEGGIMVDATPTGMPIGVGPMIQLETIGSREARITVVGPVVLAYKVIEIVRKRGSEMKMKDYNRGALLNGKLTEEDQENEYEVVHQDFDDGIADFGTGHGSQTQTTGSEGRLS